MINIARLLERLQNKIVDVNKEKNDLKCCGNCVNNFAIDIGLVREESCTQEFDSDSSCKYCDKWEYDGLRRADRQI